MDEARERGRGRTRRQFLGTAAATAALGPALVSGAAAEASSGRGRRHGRGGGPLVVAEQGSFMVGGTVVQAPGTFDPNEFISPAGGTLHGDHAYVQYQIPPNAREHPLVLWHGGGQFSKTWETTPDGREGYQNIFLRRGWSVYLLDQPGRGRAGQMTAGATITPVTTDGSLWQVFRLGLYPGFFPGTQFPATPEAVAQYWRQVTPNTGPEPNPVDAGPHPQVDATVALFEEIGPAILVTHSQSGRYGWLTRIKSPDVVAIVSYEPATFVYPSDAVPGAIPGPPHPFVAGITAPIVVQPDEFERLLDIPIQIVYGDNVERDPSAQSPYPGIDLWRAVAIRAEQFAAAINDRGGRASILHLPDAGLHGHTHFPFSDLNNLQVADLLSEHLRRPRLDRR